MNVLFCLYGDFASNSALHVAHLANNLCARGHDCVVAVPTGLPSLNSINRVAFTPVEFDSLLQGEPPFRNGREPEIVHAWTGRESIRRFLELYRPKARGARLLVHLEDHEPYLTAAALGATQDALRRLSDEALNEICGLAVTHPHHGPALLQSADGVTVIVERLLEHVPANLAKHVIWPAADETIFHPQPRRDELRAGLGLPPGAFVVFYHGNTHAANAREMRSLYLAIALLNHRGLPARLIRCGKDAVEFLGVDDHWVRPYVLPLGPVRQHHLPGLMGLADAFVQPGVPGRFNDYRFPSKLPEFFAIGRPVVLPRTNLGLHVEHLKDAYVLDRADGSTIADALAHLHREPELARRLGEGALAFARRHFSWPQGAARLEEFYHRVAG